MAFAPLKLLGEAVVCIATTTVGAVVTPLVRAVRRLPGMPRSVAEPRSGGFSDARVKAQSMKQLRKLKKGWYVRYLCKCEDGEFCEKMVGAWHRGAVDGTASFCFGKVDKNIKFAKALIVREYNPRRCHDRENTP